MDIETICEKMKEIYEGSKKYKKVIIIGAGFGGNIACEEFERYEEEIIGMYDNDPLKESDHFYYSEKRGAWISCHLLKEISAFREDVLYLISASEYYEELVAQLKETLGGEIERNCLNSRLYLRSREWEAIKPFYESLQKKESQRTLCALLTADLTHDTGYYFEIYKRDQYFGIPEFNGISWNEVLCEVGTYMGETIEKYIWERSAMFKKIYAFEPSEREFNATKHRVNRLKQEWGISDDRIELVEAAVGKKEGTISLQQGNGLVSRVTKSAEQKVKMISLDLFLKEERVSFVIADIEGFEMDMLEGMEHIIKRDKPKIAVAAYHRPSDLWKIQGKLASLREDYKFDMVHHGVSASETVLYAY